MTELVRFGVSLQKALLDKFDRLIRAENSPNRSEALRDLIREKLVRKEWIEGKKVAGAIVLVYDHHRRDLLNSLVDVQHDFHHLIIANQHIHLDHNNCLEIIVTEGNPREVQELANRLKSTKGVKHGQLSMTTTGTDIE